MKNLNLKSRPTPSDNGSVHDLTQRNVELIRELEESAKQERTRSDKVAEVIAKFCGSMTFVWVHIIWFGVWITINVFPGLPHVDPFPFTFLTLVVSLEAIFLSTFILISQNHDAKISDRRNHLDLQINLLSEQENTKMLQLLREIAEKLGVNPGKDPTVAALEQATQPDKLVEQIEKTIAEKKVFAEQSAKGGDPVLPDVSQALADPKHIYPVSKTTGVILAKDSSPAGTLTEGDLFDATAAGQAYEDAVLT
jgi:uncharacterized membrane protein